MNKEQFEKLVWAMMCRTPDASDRLRCHLNIYVWRRALDGMTSRRNVKEQSHE